MKMENHYMTQAESSAFITAMDSYNENKWLQDNLTPIWKGEGEYLGLGYISGDYLMVHHSSGDYEIPLDQVEQIINFSDTSKPSGYYRVK